MAGLNAGHSQSGNQGVAAYKAVFGMPFDNPIHSQDIPVMRTAQTVEERVQVMVSAYKARVITIGVLAESDGDVFDLDNTNEGSTDHGLSKPNPPIEVSGMEKFGQEVSARTNDLAPKDDDSDWTEETQCLVLWITAAKHQVLPLPSPIYQKKDPFGKITCQEGTGEPQSNC